MFNALGFALMLQLLVCGCVVTQMIKCWIPNPSSFLRADVHVHGTDANLFFDGLVGSYKNRLFSSVFSHAEVWTISALRKKLVLFPSHAHADLVPDS